MHTTGFFSIWESNFHLFYISYVFNLENELIYPKSIKKTVQKLDLFSYIKKMLIPSVLVSLS